MSEKSSAKKQPAAHRGREAAEKTPATSGGSGPSRAAMGLLAALLLAAVVATYWNHFDNAFHFDDVHVLVENVYVRDLANVPLFFTDPATKSTLPTNRAYRPLLLVTLAVDYALGGGLEPFFFHLSTFLWYLVQGGLMFLLYLEIARGARPHPWNGVIALLMVGWYLLHPANAETINYVTARSDSLSTLSVVAAFVIHQRARSWRRHLAWVPILLGILIKPSPVMFVPLLFLYALLFEERIGFSDLATARGRTAVWRQLVRILPGAILVVALFWLTMAMTPETWVPGGASRWHYLITQPFVVLRYFGLFFLPIDLTADTDWTPLASVLDLRFFAGMAFVALALWLAAWASNRAVLRPISFGILWFFLALAPTSSLVPLAEVTNDHRMFFPFVGLTLAAGWTLGLLAIRTRAGWAATRGRRAAVGAAIAFALLACAWGTYARNEVWQDEETLWRDVTLKSPRNGRGLMNYGLTQMGQGRFAIARRYFERALDTPYGQHPYLYVNLAIAQDGLGRPREAERSFQEALRRSAGFPAVHYFYARWLHQQGRDQEALRELGVVLRESPGYDDALRLRETIRTGSPVEVEEAEALVSRNPTPENLIELSLRLFRAERYEESLAAARRALVLRPDYPEAHNNVCAANNALGRWEEAIAACAEALRLRPDYPLARNNLAWALQRRDTIGQSP